MMKKAMAVHASTVWQKGPARYAMPGFHNGQPVQRQETAGAPSV
jgi:hypothetical protein